MPSAAVTIDPTLATDFFVNEETPHKIVYKFWVRRQGEGWQAIGPEETDDERSDHWIFLPPLPPGSIFAYWLGVWGKARSTWRTRLTIAQRPPTDSAGSWVIRASWTESGTTGDQGNGFGVDATNVVRVTLQ